jgi:putative transposase
MAVSHDGEQTILLNGRLLRAKRQYQNKLKATVSAKIDVKKKGSRRRKRLVKSKQIKRLNNQIKDIEHKQTTRLISTLHASGVQMVVLGDVHDIRQDLDVGTKTNQKLHQWSHGSIRHKLTYKAERHGMVVALQEESSTSQTCPCCGNRYKPRGRVYHCSKCGFHFHRDGIGAMNIRAKYQGIFGSSLVVGSMAHPTGMRYFPHVRVARGQLREAAGL